MRSRHLASLSPAEATAQPADVMLHELLVHKVELEMQIEELAAGAHVALEEARDRYAEYYEFAPVGYLSIGGAGEITEVNLTGAALLGVDRGADQGAVLRISSRRGIGSGGIACFWR
jgi:PAS domain-containing protein